MSEWVEKTLGDFIALKRGYDLTSSEREEGSIPVMGAAGQNGFHSIAKSKAPGIIVGRSGGSYGKVHLVTQDYWPHNTAMYVTDFKGNDPYFVYCYLKNLNFDALNSGSAQPSLNRNYLYPLKILVPLIAEQQNIAKVLKSLDDKIDLNTRINAELESMIKTIYDYWFVQFDFPSISGKPYKSSGGPMVYSKSLKRDIPSGWSEKHLADIVKNTKEKTAAGRNSSLHYLPIDNLPRRRLVSGKYTSNEEAKSSLILFKKYDIIFGAMRPYFHKVCLALEDGITRTTALILRPRNVAVQFFALMTVNTEASVNYATKNSTGSTIPYTFWDNGFENFPIAMPPENTLLEFNALVKEWFEKQISNEMENRKLIELRNWLLPMLMNGQVKVTS